LHHSLTYPEGSNCTENHQLYDERKPAEVHDAILSAEVVGFSTILLPDLPSSKSQYL